MSCSLIKALRFCFVSLSASLFSLALSLKEEENAAFKIHYRLVERLAKDDDKIALSLSLIENLAHRARVNPGPAGSESSPASYTFNSARIRYIGLQLVADTCHSSPFPTL